MPTSMQAGRQSSSQLQDPKVWMSSGAVEWRLTLRHPVASLTAARTLGWVEEPDFKRAAIYIVYVRVLRRR